MNSDVLKNIASFLDEATLKNLSRDPSIWEKISPVIDQYFWYLKAQRLVGIDLQWEKNEIENWHQVYNILSDLDKKIDPFSRQGALRRPENEYNLLAVKILLKLGLDPSKSDYDTINDAVRSGTPEVVKILLDDGRTNLGIHRNLLSVASRYARLDVMKTLLADPRTGVDEYISRALETAISRNVPESVKFLLPLANEEIIYEALSIAAREGYTEMFSLLLQDDRSYDEPLEHLLAPAIRENHLDVARIILQDKRIELSGAYIDQALSIAVQYDKPIILRELLADSRFSGYTGALNRTLKIASENGMMNVVKIFLEDEELNFGEGILLSAVNQGQIDVVELLLTDERTGSSKYVTSLLKIDLLKKYSDRMIDTLIRGKNTDFQLLSTEVLNYIISHTREYIADAIEGSSILSGRNEDIYLRDISQVYDSFSKDHYELLLRELILKRLDLEYYLEWILKKLREDSTSAETRRLFSEVARSLSEEIEVHSSPLFTAYRGFMLLAVSSDSRLIMNTLESEEGATKEGLELAGGLIGAFLGEKKLER